MWDAHTCISELVCIHQERTEKLPHLASSAPLASSSPPSSSSASRSANYNKGSREVDVKPKEQEWLKTTSTVRNINK